jgi:hypothetical protein
MPSKPRAISFDDLDELASNQVDLTLLPESFTGQITEAEIKDDKQKNRCLYITISLDDDVEIDGEKGDGEHPRLVRQKFTVSIVGEFKDHLAKLGYDEIPLNEGLAWETEKLGRSQNPRWFPSSKSGKNGNNGKGK